MNVDLLFKIAAVGILVAVLHQVLCRAGREEQAMMTTLAGLVIVLTFYKKKLAHFLILLGHCLVCEIFEMGTVPFSKRNRPHFEKKEEKWKK